MRLASGPLAKDPLEKMNNTFLAPALALILLIASLAANANDDPEAKKIAIREFVASQNMTQSWPELIRVMSANGVQRIRQGAIDAMRENSALPDADRARLLGAVDQMAPQASDELSDALRSLDATSLMQDVALQVYGKYFSAAELSAIAKFYSGEPGKKLLRLTPTLMAEAKKPGAAPAERYFTAAEITEINAFGASPAARKMKETAAVVRRETQDLYSVRSSAIVAPVIERFRRRIAELVAMSK